MRESRRERRDREVVSPAQCHSCHHLLARQEQGDCATAREGGEGGTDGGREGGREGGGEQQPLTHTPMEKYH